MVQNTTTEPRGSQKLVLVAGATGYLGKFLVRECKARGFRVRALARSENKLGWARKDVDEVFVGEATDRTSLEGICEGVDTVITSLGITRQTDKVTYNDVDYGANSTLISLARKANVRRFIFVSVFAAEKTAFTDMVGARERAVMELKSGKGMEWVVVRPTGFFVDMKEFLDMAVAGRVWMLGDGSSQLNPIHGADLAQVCADAISSKADEELCVGGPQVLSQREIGEIAFQVAGGKPACTGVPIWTMTRIVLPCLRLVARRIWNPLAMMTTMAKDGAVAPKYGQRRLVDFFREEMQARRQTQDDNLK